MKKSTSITRNHSNKWHKRIAKGKHINFLSRLRLWWRGIWDGARGYPRPDDAGGRYSSPFIHREIADYQALCSQMWSELQQTEADVLSKVQRLSASLAQAKKELACNRAALTTSHTASAELQRYKGESHLSDPQIQARRTREKAKAQAPLYQKVERLERQVEGLSAQVYTLYIQLEEDANTVRLLTQTAYSHTLQRISIYWDAALSRLPDKQSAPHAYGELAPDAQTIYLQAHQEKMDALFKELKKEAA